MYKRQILTFANVLCAFTFYFVFVHSKLHERNWLPSVPRSDFLILRGLTVIVTLTVLVLTIFFANAGGFPTIQDPVYQFIRNIFLILGSLTVSHMVLAWVAYRRTSPQLNPLDKNNGQIPLKSNSQSGLGLAPRNLI